MRCWEFVWTGVWRDNRNTWQIRLLKTLNLSVRTVLRSDLQTTACALTYRSLLALVPALALLFAIGRGFGFQNLLTTQLFNYFPSQQKALETAFRFVDSYLAQASEGIFVGVGIVVLLWTLISLVGAVEDAFNDIWGVRSGRSLVAQDNGLYGHIHHTPGTDGVQLRSHGVHDIHRAECAAIHDPSAVRTA